MERKLVISILKDSQFECQEIANYVATVDGIQIAGITANTSEAVKNVSDFLPDAVILDLELHKGSGNGLDFLKQVRELHLPIFPYMLVTTHNTSILTHEYARALGADFIITKNQIDYCAKNIVEFLRSAKITLFSRDNQHELTVEIPLAESCNQPSKKISDRINLELDLIGVSPKVLGRKYLFDSIAITIGRSLHNISKIIGTKYNKTNASVERAMQNAIIAAWKNSDADDLNKFYTAKINSEKGVPTLMEFISYYSNKIEGDD